MGLFDWGRAGNTTGQTRSDANAPAASMSEDERAIERYRYLLRTAPPETIEQAHAEAFAQLTPEQRRRVLEQLAASASPAERPVLERAADTPQSLARAATRAEMRQPGVLERMFTRTGPTPGMASGGGGMPGFGSMMAGSLLGSIAGTVLGSAIAHQFLSQPAHAQALGDLGLGPDSAGSDLADNHHFANADAPGDDASFDQADLDSGDMDLGGMDSGTFDV